MDPKRSLTLRFLAEPTDVNFGGKVHGGAVMKWIDLAGYACAAGWSGRYCVTAYVGGIRFVSAVHVGNLVELEAKVIYTGRTSMHIAIDVYAADPKSAHRRKTTNCIIVMVAVDESGHPVPVPKWLPETEDDKRLHAGAEKLMDMRKEIAKQMDELPHGE
ncbi:acyl-CoA thioesterase [Paraferrimonas sedimenticola]|uniref:Acyl-CoA thioesterase n=1 Tax=Paraferrimonas sedimenticola TaxID=375674 RepID=A0AA37VWQ5_9GAMM|nr:acyl-CoA thioesterase [Paraferrimonas sedimenticola]GLP96491.1 acyl-CoA thioesterase [Paraferrimonas sedimenticola]